MSALSRLRRSLAFSRYIPPAQIIRRLELTLRRRLRDLFGWRAREPRVIAAPSPPRPIFSPRSGMIAEKADSLTFTFLGRAREMPRDAIDWRGPPDQLWRMNLHFMEYLEEIADASFAAIADAWIDDNPPDRPGAWKDSWNAYALSLRLVVWMQQCATRGASERMLASLARQLAFLAANLETDIGGNHLIKNIKALLWGAAFFAGADAELWRKLGLRYLRDALREQILADGVHYERSPSYHGQVFADLLECRHALGAKSPPELDAALRAMAVATADLAHPDGAVAQFNDAGLSMAYRPGECLNVFHSLFGERPAPRASFAFARAGYFGWRSGGDYFVADCGRIGPDALPAHAHGDILSFEWSVAGERIIVDPGVYEYVDGPRRKASRSAASHNTLCFEGADQAEFFGAFRCGRRPNVRVLFLEQGPEGLTLEGMHDGFLPARHARRFEVDASGLRVTDRIVAPEGRRASIGFLLHPDVAIAADGGGFALSRGRARVKMTSSAKIVVEEATWWPDMGYERRTKRLRIHWEGRDGGIATMWKTGPA